MRHLVEKIKFYIKQGRSRSIFIVWIVVIFAVLILIINSIFSYKNAKIVGEKALENQALGIAVTLQGLMTYTSLEEINYNAFLNILLTQDWRNLDFIMLFDEDGEILLHSNPELIGYKLSKEDLQEIKSRKLPYCRFVITLEEGEELKIFVADFNFKTLKDSLFLRVGIFPHTYDLIVRKAEVFLTLKLLASLGLILIGIFATKWLKNYEKMQLKMKELESISLMTRILSHEIRNPLGSIKGFAQYLFNKVDNPDHKKFLQIISKEATRIERLTDELFLYVNPVKIEIKEFDFEEVLSEVVESFKNFYPKIDFIVVKSNHSHRILSDPDKIKQILSNIIQNSVDALELSDKPDKRVILILDENRKNLVLTIRDNGIGIRKEDLPRIFDPFFTTKPRGSGLGLAIVQKLCEALNINVNVKSKVGEGTTVWLKMSKSSS